MGVPGEADGVDRRNEQADELPRLRSNLNRTVPCQIGRSPIQRFLPGNDVVFRNRPAGGDNAAKQPGAAKLSRELATCVPRTLRRRASIRPFELDEL